MTKEAIGDADVSAQVADAAAADAAPQVQDRIQDDAQPLSERDRQLAAIKARRSEELETEHQDAVNQGLAAPRGGDSAGATPPGALDPDAPVFKQDGKWMTKIKVNGEEKVVPFDSVVRTVQKHEAADVRLHQAGEIVRSAQAQAKKILDEAVIEAKNGKGKQPSSDDGDAAGSDMQAIADQIAHEFVDGNPKEGAKLLAQTLGRISQSAKATPENAGKPAIDKGEIVATVLELEDHKQKVEAVKKYRKNHPTLAGDPVLHSMVDQESAILLADPDFSYESYDELMEESVKRVKEKIKAVAAPVTSTAVTDRQERKAAAAAPGVGVAARRAAPQQPQAPTTEDKLAAMRKARGQG